MDFRERIKSANSQIELEEISKEMFIKLTVDKVKKEARKGNLSEDSNVLSNVKLYADAMIRVLDAYVDTVSDGRAMVRKMNTKLLLALGTEVCSTVTIRCILSSCSVVGVRRDVVARKMVPIFKVLLKENMIKNLGDKDSKKELKSFYGFMSKTTQSGDRKVKMAGDLVSRIYKKFSLAEPTENNFMGLATDLLTILGDIKLNMNGELIPLFNQKNTHSTSGIKVSLNKWFLDAYIEAIRAGRFVDDDNLPMIEPPLDHDGSKGSYHTPFFQFKAVQGGSSKASDFSAINALQRTPFRIDKRILEAQRTLLGEGVIAGNFEKPIDGGFDIKRPASSLNADGSAKKKEEMSDKVLKELATWTKQAGAFYNNKERINSIVGMQARNLGTADLFKDREKIYFGYYFDFRGRIYPRTSSLSPQGACESKSLLQYAVGTKMDASLECEFLANGASLFGHDKLSFEDRISWSLTQNDLFVSCAENYMDDLRWANEGKEAFMALQFCFDYVEWKKEGTNFVHHSVIPLDGTCNGLQHLAAMTHDEVSGKQVNLLPFERQDIYQDVADDLIKNLIRVNEPWTKDVLSAKIITRKFTKKSVMTKPYNVGKTTVMRSHVGDFIKDPKNNVQHLATKYPTINSDLGGLLWETMDSSTLRRPNIAMEWFGYVENLMGDEGYSYTEWLTPMGFTVHQHYLKPKTQQKETSGISGSRITYVYEKPVDVNKRKRKNALAPNFIHSMDAAHLQLTINLLEREGVKDFWFIHDSFSVPLMHTKTLKRVLREAFCTIYKDANWFKDFVKGLPEAVQDKIEWYPDFGTLDFDEIMESENFFA